MTRLARRIAALVVLVSLVATGCGGGTAPKNGTGSESGGKKSEAVVGLNADPVCLLPYDTNDNLSFGIEATIYEGLVGFDRNMKIVPQLAERWDVSPDAKTYTFYLNPKAKFADGTPVTAEAVKQSFEWLLDPSHKLKRYSLYSVIDRVEAVDEHTVRFILKQPFGAMLATFAHPAGKVIEPSALAKGKDYLCRHPEGGTGPFVFKEWQQGDHVTVTRNANYWDPSNGAGVDSIRFRFIPEAGTLVAGLKTGEIDVVSPLPGDQAVQLKKSNEIDVVAAPSIYSFYMAMNVTKKPFNDPRVRQALNYAVDREALRNVVLRGFADEIHSPIAPQVQFAINAGTYTRDVAKAKALLAQAGYPNGFSATVWVSNDTERIRLAVALQQQLAEVGVKLNVVPLESAAMSDMIWNSTRETSKLELYLGGWSPSTGDADWGLRPLLATESAPPSGYNVGFYSNPEVDRLLHDALNTADDSRRAQDYAQAQRLIWQDAPWVFLYVPQNVWATRANVQDVWVQPDGILSVRHLHFK